MGKHRTFTPEYRREAARLVIESGRPIAQVARELGLGAQLLSRWVLVERASTEPGEPESGGEQGALSLDERAELARLRRENSELRKDRDFLKKAAAFFASDNNR
ncbi:transposase [Kribbella sp. NPDC051620]|uniref:transposase n=1 Tax=Kribbella sp. NPDC051620 TaxID=3364120 RepID=UPI00378D2EF5